MPAYNPFGKPLGSLTATDLQILRQVSEGWYIEYKSEVPAPAAIGKSLAAFANHYGGWLFYGVAGSNDERNVAAEFPGIPNDELPRHQERIRDSVAAHAHPPPHFEVAFLPGPETSIGLAGDRSIIAIEVPLGHSAPYVHSSGRIYRRVADRSDPTHETDRHVLDLLWQRGDKARERFRELFFRDVELSKAEADRPVLTLHLLRDPLFEQRVATEISYEDFVGLMKSPPGAGIPFDAFSSVSGGYLARQVADNSPRNLCVTWEHRFDGTSIVTIPMRYGHLVTGTVPDELQRYRNGARFCEALNEMGHGESSWTDLSLLFGVARISLLQQQRLLSAGGLPTEIRCLARAQGLWRRIPFVDTAGFVESLHEGGVPMLQTDSFTVPWQWDLDRALALEWDVGTDEDAVAPGALLTRELLHGFGLARLVESPEQFMEVVEAVGRAQTVHAARADS